MARRCGCAGTGCACNFVAGPGILITGTGSATNPYTVESTASDIGDSLRVDSTPSLGLSLLGAGTVTDPFILKGVARPALVDLVDVGDSAPAAGDVPVWVEDALGDHWEFQPPPTSPPGAVTVGVGLLGDGSGGSPLRPNLSGTYGSGLLNLSGVASTAGGPVYVDTDGKLRTYPAGLAHRATSTGMPANIAGLIVYQTDTSALVYGNGSAWLPVGSGGGATTEQIEAAVEAYFVANPATLNDANVASLFYDTSTATYIKVNDMIATAVAAGGGGGGGSFDPTLPRTITGAWTFTTAPTVPNGAFTTAKITGFDAAVDARATTIADAKVSALVGSAPAVLDTLAEISNALGGDPNLRTTLLNQIATKANDNAVVHLTGTETVAGNKTFTGTTSFTTAPSVPDNSFTLAKINGAQAAINERLRRRGDFANNTSYLANDLVRANTSRWYRARVDHVSPVAGGAPGLNGDSTYWEYLWDSAGGGSAGTLTYARVFQNADGTWPAARPDATSVDAVRITEVGLPQPGWLVDNFDFVLEPR